MCIGPLGSSLELWRAGKRLQLWEKLNQVEHVERLAVVGLCPWTKTGNECLNSLIGQR